MTLPGDARAVVIGAGIAGSSIAYHLTLLGWKEVVVVDRGPLAGGTTSHAPGLVGQLRSSASLTRILMDSVSLYRELRSGGEAGYFEVGSLRAASSRPRLEELKRQAALARAAGLEAELIGPRETVERCPVLERKGLQGALWIPSDGSARAPVLARALAEGARERGASFHERTRVTGFEVKGGRIRAVVTDRGSIRAETAVAACGIWTPRVAALLGIPVPLIPMQHQYAATGPLDALRGRETLPNFRDPDGLVYMRQDGDTIVLGGYERNPAPFEVDGIPENDNPTVLEFDPERFEGLHRAMAERIPVLRGAPLVKRVNGLESFTPDGEFILGESGAVRGFWMACGFCAHGVSGSGGIGKAVAEWIVAGEPTLDLWHMDLRRFPAHARSRRWVRERATEVYATYYDVGYPGQEKQSARGLRRSPLWSRLRALGAVFGEKAGWERPNWFLPNGKGARGAEHPKIRGWAARLWPRAVGAEHRACRERVALFDETSFAKFEVSGPNALALLERLAANRMDRPVGSVTYTQFLNERGGIECDLTVTRTAADRFRIVTGTAFGPHDLAWIRRHAPTDGSVEVRDTTSAYACIGVWGPRARDLLQPLTTEDVSNAAFPYLTAREITVAEVPVLATRVTYVGELGWELYAATEYGARLWDALWEAGEPLGAVAAGYRAIDSLRLEKGYRYWSQDIDPEHDPFEAGLAFAVKLGPEKGDFIGRAALERAKASGPPRRRLCAITMDDPGAVALGGEPILSGGSVVSRVTSAGYGFTVGKSIAYGYLPAELARPGSRVEVELFGKMMPATVAREPLHDPKGERVKA